MKPTLVYIAGPYRGRTTAEITGNIRRAEQYTEKLLRMGFFVYCPHKNTSHLDGCVPETFFLDMGLEMLRRCDAIFVMPDSEYSLGTAAEIQLARELGKEFIFEEGLNG